MEIDSVQTALTAQVTDMGKIKRTARQAAGKAKEAVAEILGDGKLQEEAKAEQRKSEDEKAEDKKPSSLNPLGNLNRLT